jgi:hypothetical protein
MQFGKFHMVNTNCEKIASGSRGYTTLPRCFCSLRVVTAASPPHRCVAAALAEQLGSGQRAARLTIRSTDVAAAVLGFEIDGQAMRWERGAETSRHATCHDEALTSVSLYLQGNSNIILHAE